MTSDYVSRLRAELLRAGAAEQSRRRRARAVARLRPVAAMAAVVVLAVTVMLAVRGERRDGVPAEDAMTLTYRVQSGDAGAAAQIIRARLSAAHITAKVVARDGTLAITAPHETRDDVTALSAPGRLAIYDWERSVLGPDGRPAPTDISVTGGMAGGQDGEVTEAEARSRAAKRAGARAAQAERGWFALAGPALTNADVTGARTVTDPSGGPAVQLDLTPAGQEAFTALTREVARRGAAEADGAEPLRSAQHLAFVLDDRILATPFINWREAPHGFDGAEGAELGGLPSPERARITAALLSAGPLPADLQRIPG